MIEGGGWTLVGDERIRVAAGEAIVWPADVVHAAWTDYSNMRAIVVEFAGADDARSGDPRGTAAWSCLRASRRRGVRVELAPPGRPLAARPLRGRARLSSVAGRRRASSHGTPGDGSD